MPDSFEFEPDLSYAQKDPLLRPQACIISIKVIALDEPSQTNRVITGLKFRN